MMNNTLELKLVDGTNLEEMKELSAFATEIVKEHYDPLLGSVQNDYMLQMFQSVEAIKKQIQHGYRYYLGINQGKKVSFIAFYPNGDRMYLSKFYVHKNARGNGYASKMLSFIKEHTKKEGLKAIYLNVNKYNDTSIAIYKHLGFQQIAAEKNDIGNGYFMDDYVMEYRF